MNSKKVISTQSGPTNIVQQRDATGDREPNAYPSLPNLGTYDPQPSQQVYPQQVYPQPTYAGQYRAQQQGQVYQPSENTHLLPS